MLSGRGGCKAWTRQDGANVLSRRFTLGVWLETSEQPIGRAVSANAISSTSGVRSQSRVGFTRSPIAAILRGRCDAHGQLLQALARRQLLQPRIAEDALLRNVPGLRRPSRQQRGCFIRRVHLRGHQQWQIPPTAIAAISRDIEDRRILDLTQAQLDSACRDDVFDAPTTTLKLTRNRQHVTLTDKSAKRMSATKRRRRFTAPGKSLGDQNSQCRHHPENVMARNSRSDGSAYAPPTLA